MFEHKQIKTEAGKWYVSEAPPVQRRSETPNYEHNYFPGAHDAILVEPFATKDEAEKWAEEFEQANANAKGKTYVWQAHCNY